MHTRTSTAHPAIQLRVAMTAVPLVVVVRAAAGSLGAGDEQAAGVIGVGDGLDVGGFTLPRAASRRLPPLRLLQPAIPATSE